MTMTVANPFADAPAPVIKPWDTGVAAAALRAAWERVHRWYRGLPLARRPDLQAPLIRTLMAVLERTWAARQMNAYLSALASWEGAHYEAPVRVPGPIPVAPAWDEAAATAIRQEMAKMVWQLACRYGRKLRPDPVREEIWRQMIWARVDGDLEAYRHGAWAYVRVWAALVADTTKPEYHEPFTA